MKSSPPFSTAAVVEDLTHEIKRKKEKCLFNWALTRHFSLFRPVFHFCYLSVFPRRIYSHPRGSITAVYPSSSANGYLLPLLPRWLRMEHRAGSSQSISFGCQHSVFQMDTKERQNRQRSGLLINQNTPLWQCNCFSLQSPNLPASGKNNIQEGENNRHGEQAEQYSRSFVQGERMKINEKRVARPPKAAKLEIHFEGNLICCKWAKNILRRNL